MTATPTTCKYTGASGSSHPSSRRWGEACVTVRKSPTDFDFCGRNKLFQGSNIARDNIARQVCPAWSHWIVLALHSKEVHVFCALWRWSLHLFSAIVNVMRKKAYIKCISVYIWILSLRFWWRNDLWLSHSLQSAPFLLWCDNNSHPFWCVWLWRFIAFLISYTTEVPEGTNC